MQMTNAPLTSGTPILVATAGRQLPGTVLRLCADGFVVVRLKGEHHPSEWHPALVVRA